MRNPGVMPLVLAPTTVNGGIGPAPLPGPRFSSSVDIRFLPCRFVKKSLSGTSPRVLIARDGVTGGSFELNDCLKKSYRSLMGNSGSLPTLTGGGSF